MAKDEVARESASQFGPGQCCPRPGLRFRRPGGHRNRQAPPRYRRRHFQGPRLKLARQQRPRRQIHPRRPRSPGLPRLGHSTLSCPSIRTGTPASRAAWSDYWKRIRDWLRPGGLLLFSYEAGEMNNVTGEWLGVPDVLQHLRYRYVEGACPHSRFRDRRIGYRNPVGTGSRSPLLVDLGAEG